MSNIFFLYFLTFGFQELFYYFSIKLKISSIDLQVIFFVTSTQTIRAMDRFYCSIIDETIRVRQLLS